MPLLATEVPLDSELSYFGYVIRPGGDEEQPIAKLRLAVKKDGRQQSVNLDLPMAPLGDGLFMYASNVNLAAFQEAGEYELKFKVTDPNSEASTTREVTLKIVD
jgi:hypothetical protein